MMTSKMIKTEALELPPLEKIRLVELLLESLEGTDERTMAKWAMESEKRFDAMENGKVQPKDYNDVMKRFKR